MNTKDFQTKSKLNIFWYYLKKHKGLFILDLSCALVVALIDLIYPIVSRKCLYTLLPEKAYTAFFAIMGIIAAAYFLRSCLYYVVTFWGHRFGVLVEADMRLDLFKHIQSLEYSFFDRNRTGQLMSRITSELFEIVELAHHGPEDILISLVTIAGSLIIVATIEWRLALVLAVLIPVFLLLLLRIRRRQREVSMGVKVSTGKINTQVESNLSGIKTGKAFANEEIEFGKFAKSVDDFKESKKEFYKIMAVFMASMEFFCTIISVVVMTIGGWLIMQGELNYIDLLTFCLYINTFITPVRKLVNFSETYANGTAGFRRFVEIMQIEPAIQDAADAKDLEYTDGAVDFNHVTFSYDGRKNVINDISLHIKGGETVAVVGSSGGGKTSLCQLLPRFYDVQKGSVTIDGQDIRFIRQKSLHENIGIVQQDVFLFADTVLENIRYGKPSASNEEVLEAARKAKIYDDVMAMPDGFGTYVGERGTLLSGGQKQRIAIARIFLKNPPILILDEATSALDSVTEAHIQGAFDDLSVGRTCLIIAHRLSTVRKASRIVVVDHGKIVEEGSQESLLEAGGVYAELYKTQAGWDEIR